MDNSERLALEYLESLKLGQVVYEPDGNIPPDFLVGGEIAVEVRRLNENSLDASGRARGLEHDQYALRGLIIRVLSELGPPSSGRSWFVTYDFQRPLPPFRQLKQLIRDFLVRFRDGQSDTLNFNIGDEFRMALYPASNVHPTCFVLGGYSDFDSGGFLIGILESNLKFCIREKSLKISKYRQKYSEWWLLLIDKVAYGHWEAVSVEHDWNRVLLLDPNDPLRVMELKSRTVQP